MYDVLKKRKSDEQIEIVAYLLKHKPVDLKDKQEVSQVIDWLSVEIKKRQYAHKYYGASNQNKDYIYVLEEYQRFNELMKGA